MICFLSLLGRIECSISIGRRWTALESKSSAGHFDWHCNNSQYFYSGVFKAYTLWKQCNILIGTATTPSTFRVESSKPTLFGNNVTISLKV